MIVISIEVSDAHANDINNNTLVRGRRRDGEGGWKNNELHPDQPRSKNFLDRTIHQPLCSCLIDGTSANTRNSGCVRAAQSQKCHFDSADYHELMDYFYFEIEYNFGLLQTRIRYSADGELQRLLFVLFVRFVRTGGGRRN